MIANQCNISKEYLARFFKKEMELTIENYINNVRAEHAYHELKHSKNNLTQIAINNEFSNIRTMNRAFDKLYDESASKIKKKRSKYGNLRQLMIKIDIFIIMKTESLRGIDYERTRYFRSC